MTQSVRACYTRVTRADGESSRAGKRCEAGLNKPKKREDEISLVEYILLAVVILAAAVAGMTFLGTPGG